MEFYGTSAENLQNNFACRSPFGDPVATSCDKATARYNVQVMPRIPSISCLRTPVCGSLPPNARCPDYESGRVLAEADAFIDQWTAHGMPLTAGRELRYDQFVLVGVDERAAGVSGCSVDALVRRMQQLESVLGLELVNNGPVLYREGEAIERVSRDRFAELAASGTVGPTTRVFDNTLTRVGDLLAGKWEVKASEPGTDGRFSDLHSQIADWRLIRRLSPSILRSANLLIFHRVSLPLVARRAATDWPQFLGPIAKRHLRRPALTESGRRRARASSGASRSAQGLSGPVVAQNRLILFHRVDDREVVESLDARTGAPQWRHAYPTTYRDDFGFDEGPRAVPVVADGVVYTFGAEGKLHAIDLATGKPLWNVDTMRQFGVAKGFFGAAGSPLVEDGRVIANIGGKKAGIVAFDAKTGKVLWTATSDAASYSSGVAATILGKRYAVFLTREGLVGLDPATGRCGFSGRGARGRPHRSTPRRRS